MAVDVCFCAELHRQAKARTTGLLHPYQKTIASHQKIPFVIVVDAGALCFQPLLITLIDGLGQEMHLQMAAAAAAHLSETDFFSLVATAAPL